MQPTDLETSISLLARTGTCFGASFSPDGKRIAFLSNLSGVFQVWTVAASGGWPERITPLDDRITAVKWSPNGEWLAFSLAPGGGMNEQVYIIRPDGRDLTLLTGGGKETNWLEQWSPDGASLYIASNRRDPDAMEIFRIAIPDGEPQRVIGGLGRGHLEDVSRDGGFGVLCSVLYRSDTNVFLVDLTTAEATLLTPHDGPGNFHSGTFSPDGSTIYLASDLRRDRVAFAHVRVTSDWVPGEIETLVSRDDADLQDFALSPDGREAALIWNVSGRTELEFVDLVTLERAPVANLPAECVTDLTYSEDSRLLALTITGSATPRDIWVLDRHSGRLSQITFSPHPGVALDLLVRPELVRFPAHDGLELSGWLYSPPEFSSPGPVVLDFHGGPEGQAQPVFNATYHALNQQGIAVLSPNVRGSSGFGKRFVNLDNGALRFDAIRDIKACVDYLVDGGIAASGHIGITGGSYGGYMTMAGLTEFPELFAAGANLFGVVNYETFFEHTEPWMAAISKVEYGDPETQVELLRQLSPIHRIDRVVAPTLILHGANDTNVPLIEAEQLGASLEAQGTPVESIIFPDEGHGFVKEPNRIRSATAIVNWFVRYLLVDR